MNELFKKDITIKIIAVLSAILFWLYVYNTSNPFKTTTFTIPLKIENENFPADNGYIIKNKYKTNVDVTIRGRQDAVDKVRDTDIEAALDFAQIKSVNDKELKIIGPACSQKDVTIESFSPKTIQVQLARSKNNAFNVNINQNITFKQGYQLLKMTVNPDTLNIVGEDAIVNSVGSITGNLDIKDLDKSVTKKIDCKVLDSQGKEITSLSGNLTVEVSLEVAKQVPVTPKITGKPAVDFVETSRAVNPGTVLITGSPDVLNRIGYIETGPVDIDNIKQNINKTVPLLLPDGVKLADPAVKEASVSVTVDQLIVKDITIPKDNISIANKGSTMNYNINTDSISLQLKGRMSDLNGITPDNIKPLIDVTGLDEGIHKIPLNITLPSQVKLMQDAVVEVKVSKAVQNPE